MVVGSCSTIFMIRTEYSSSLSSRSYVCFFIFSHSTFDVGRSMFDVHLSPPRRKEITYPLFPLPWWEGMKGRGRGGNSPIVLRLLLKQICVFSGKLYQLFVASSFYNASILKYKDVVSHTYSGKPVAYEDSSPALPSTQNAQPDQDGLPVLLFHLRNYWFS